MQSREETLIRLGFPLEVVPSAAANYLPVVVRGATAYVSGALPFDGRTLLYPGKVGREVALEEARKAAALAAANVLRVLRVELGSLSRITRVLKVGGFVSSTEEFTEQHLVLNGASDLFVEVLGEAGRSARAAVGVAQLPLGASVEVDAIIEVSPQ